MREHGVKSISNLWDYSVSSRHGVTPIKGDSPREIPPASLLREEDADLPELSELDIIRHYTRLSQLNFSIDTNFYPLGSCTMKYNPRINERCASLDGFLNSHPYEDEEDIQGNLELLYKLQQGLADLGGFTGATVQPAAGAQGELTGVLMIKKYLQDHNQVDRDTFLIPDSAHGTNPATVSMAGFKTKEIPSDKRGNIDFEALKSCLGEHIAGIMITNPNTLGLFEENIVSIIEAVHACGGLVYGDGANFNAIMGIVKPGDLGFDVMHYNLHKTFSTPHGGGGPGAGAVLCNSLLEPYLPSYQIIRKGSDQYGFQTPKCSIGQMKPFFGNFAVLVRAYTYFISLGIDGIQSSAEGAVLGANYVRSLLKEVLPAYYDRPCMHEFVSSGHSVAKEIHTLDIAKRLIDFGFHPPTVYFPLIVPEALMIEPTECESRETLEAFALALSQIVKEGKEEPHLLQEAPHNRVVSRLDETLAVKKPILIRKAQSELS